MAGTYSKLLYPLVFSTKRRAPMITPDVQRRLYAYMGGIVRAEGGIAHEIGGMSDHVHLLVSWRADKPLTALVRTVKGRTSTWVHETFENLRSFYWQDGYGAFTVSPSQFETVNRYILNQERHHCRRTFDEEFLQMLDAHGIEYDRRYVLD